MFDAAPFSPPPHPLRLLTPYRESLNDLLETAAPGGDLVFLERCEPLGFCNMTGAT